MLKEITANEIRLSYESYCFDGVKAGERIIGQDKALGLLRLGLAMNRYGYNIFISGEDGTGRLSDDSKSRREHLQKSIVPRNR